MKKIVNISRELCAKVDKLQFPSPVLYVYNPLNYARIPHEKYLKAYAKKGAVLLLGMNPGPFGMAQTGVPFGDVAMVRDFLKIEGAVGQPPKVHPKRPVDGFACNRSEVSGTRLWGWARDCFGTADRFFDNFFVANYCPLVFMGETGKNVTPDKLPKESQISLFNACDEALLQTALALDCETVVGIGAFAKQVCERALHGLDVKIGKVLHPSPASPAANRGWAEAAEKQFTEMGLPG